MQYQIRLMYEQFRVYNATAKACIARCAAAALLAGGLSLRAHSCLLCCAAGGPSR